MYVGTVQRRFLGMNECSQFLGVTKGTLYVWVCHRKIPYQKIGRLVKFDMNEIELWLKETAVAKMN